MAIGVPFIFIKILYKCIASLTRFIMVFCDIVTDFKSTAVYIPYMFFLKADACGHLNEISTYLERQACHKF